MKICVISDTHIHNDEDFSPELKDILKKYKHFIHAGDITSLETLKFFKKHGDITAVRGNMDGYPLDEILNEKEVIDIENVRIGICHGAGSPHNIEERMLTKFKNDDVQIIIFGHIHTPVLKRVGNTLLLNPGSLTSNRTGKYETYATIDTDNDFTIEFHELR